MRWSVFVASLIRPTCASLLVFHSSYVRHAKSILMGSGVLAGGDKGLSGRGCVYASVADWTRFEDVLCSREAPL